MALRAPLLALVLALAAALAPVAAWAQTVVLWHAYRDDERAALDRLLDQYRRAHPGASLDVLAVPFDAYASKLESAIPHGHGPDVFIDAHERVASRLSQPNVSARALRSDRMSATTKAAAGSSTVRAGRDRAARSAPEALATDARCDAGAATTRTGPMRPPLASVR